MKFSRRSEKKEDDDEARARLQDALDNLESARISTIHGFALDILRRVLRGSGGCRPTWETWTKVEQTSRGATRRGATGWRGR